MLEKNLNIDRQEESQKMIKTLIICHINSPSPGEFCLVWS